ncbi:MAG: A/G-specific adenine glycosylase [Actinomycetota bacterium]|nr:A/G-specific adenine glycosylase [Actinomycetota bacterium]
MADRAVADGAAADALLAWSAGALRDLPWRANRDPWSVLVSETMSQQTQVARVVGPFTAFLTRWPDAAALGAAPLSEVIDAWHGLGYNRRAVRLHACAQAIVDRHGGSVPDDQAALMDLPGVGTYTARAVLAFAFERPVGVVDTNAARVLARLTGRRLGRSEAQRLADVSTPPEQSWAWNSAVLDLGATVCTARAPGCDRCPLAERACAWRAAGRPPPDPALGSAGTSGAQSRFAGSDRQGRGRLVGELVERGPIEPGRVASVAGWPGDHARAERVTLTLVSDGLAVFGLEGVLCLP